MFKSKLVKLRFQWKWMGCCSVCPTLCDPMDCSLLGSSVHGIFQARVLEWAAISFSRGSSWPRDRAQVSCIAGRRFTIWATREALDFNSVQFTSVAQSCPPLCDPMNCSTPGLPVHPQLPEFTQTQVHRVGDACHPAISSSVVPFSSWPQSLPASGSFPVSQLFAWGSQSTGVSALASVLPKNSQGWSPLEWTNWISLQSKGLSRVFSNTTVQKHQFFSAQLSSHPYMTTGKTIALTRRTLLAK